MARPLSQLALFAAVGALLWAAPSLACEKHTAAQAKPAATAAKKAPNAQPNSVMDALDAAIAGKCSCTSQADCTCKKGKCECKACGAHHRQIRMIESLKGEPSPLQLPKNARNDASAGVFI